MWTACTVLEALKAVREEAVLSPLSGRRLTEERFCADKASSDAAARARALEVDKLALRDAKHDVEDRAAELARKLEEAGRHQTALQGMRLESQLYFQ